MRFLILILLIPQLAFAECDYSTVKKVDNGYLYSTECHKATGKALKELNIREEQVENLKKTIKLKDLALVTADSRILNYQEVAYKNTERLNRLNSVQSKQNMLYFIGGIVLSTLSVYAASKAIRD